MGFLYESSMMGHPFVSGGGHRMLMLEQLTEGLQKLGAEFFSIEQAAGEWLARQ